MVSIIYYVSRTKRLACNVATHIKWYGTSYPYGPSTEVVMTDKSFCASVSVIFCLSFSVHLPRTFIRTARWCFPSKGLEETVNRCHCSHDSSRTWTKMKLRALYLKSTTFWKGLLSVDRLWYKIMCTEILW